MARFPGLALDGDVTWNGRINLRGPAQLPVSVSCPRAGRGRIVNVSDSRRSLAGYPSPFGLWALPRWPQSRKARPCTVGAS